MLVILSSSGPGPGPRSGPGQVPGQVQKVQELRTKDLDLGYTLNLVCVVKCTMYTRLIRHLNFLRYQPRHLVWVSQTYEKWFVTKKRSVSAKYASQLSAGSTTLFKLGII